MRKTRVISFLLLAIFVSVFSFFFFSNTTNFDEEVLKLPLSKDFEVVGYRNNNGGGTVGFTYHYFVKDTDVDTKLSHPFLITDDKEIVVVPKSKDRFSISLVGKVYQFNNIIWLKHNKSLIQFHTELIANSCIENCKQLSSNL
ncbi:hypothetical protein TW85_17800 [Marinomonas sp. S3726]|uniref:hypothetical protein n=1 Tax=Marinomonas sp. S3726 TaxID=579484 RepID=UPI0005F9BBE6|nr:hypothetical protein [Marinomonas sp. S3726]KJZ10925.1 hypothetical protein TW85_17800 [Marinomonas sp. S3726]